MNLPAYTQKMYICFDWIYFLNIDIQIKLCRHWKVSSRQAFSFKVFFWSITLKMLAPGNFSASPCWFRLASSWCQLCIACSTLHRCLVGLFSARGSCCIRRNFLFSCWNCFRTFPAMWHKALSCWKKLFTEGLCCWHLEIDLSGNKVHNFGGF